MVCYSLKAFPFKNLIGETLCLQKQLGMCYSNNIKKSLKTQTLLKHKISL